VKKAKFDNQDIIYGTKKDPLQELELLKNLTNKPGNAPKKEIYLYDYKGVKVFLIDKCVNCPDGVAEVNDCDGNIICIFGGISEMNTCPDFDLLWIKDSLLWKNY
jgi:hypothetical protein